MRALILSLVIGTLVTLVLLGFLMDRLYFNLSDEEGLAGHLDTVSALGGDLAVALDQSSDPQDFLQNWPITSEIPVSLLPSDMLASDEALTTALAKGGSLSLQSSEGLNIYWNLPAHKKLLQIGPLQEQSSDKRILQLIMTLLFYTVVALLLLAWLYPLIPRLIRLRKTAVGFGNGDLAARVPLSGFSYIGDIEREFNQMAERIGHLIEDNRLMNSALSHDLRTPMARLRFGIDALCENELDNENDEVGSKDCTARLDERTSRYLYRLRDDVARMETLVNSMLTYARLDQNLSVMDIHHGEIPLGSVVTECLQLHQKPGLTVNLNLTDITVSGNSDHLAMLVNNLLKNAARHARATVNVSLQYQVPESNISSALRTQGSVPVLRIEDDGPGIAAEHRQRLLLPFQRGEAGGKDAGQSSIPGTRTGNSTSNPNPDPTSMNAKQANGQHGQDESEQGFGLGLAIVERIARAHGAILTIGQSQLLGGADLSVAFPEFKSQNVSAGQ